ncbi:MAG: Ig-like domain-containing protein, partial [Bacteroidaceae bacterium]|nr:Ig-like domain-containing protein [Bacteroidaceae bacterium]
AVFQDPYSWVGVKQIDGKRYLYVYREAYDNNAIIEKDCGELTSDVVYLQARANFGTNKVKYYYSTDNVTYESASSNSFDMRFITSIFAGQRFYLFNYATRQAGGYVDIDWFSTETTFNEETFYSPERLQTFSAEDLQLDYIDAASTIEMLNGGTATLPVYAVMKSGMRQSIAAKCNYELDNPELATISTGIVTGHKEGQTNVTATWNDPQGTPHTFLFTLSVETFPLREGLFNPSIVGEGTFSQATKEFTTAAKGQAGWEYTAGLDIATEQYLVVELEEKPAVSTTLCLYDRSGSYTRTITSATTKLKLSNVTKVDKHNISRVSFQTNGGKAIRLKRVFLSDDGETPSAINSIEHDETIVAVWHTLQGVPISHPTHSGIYLRNGKKIVVK